MKRGNLSTFNVFDLEVEPDPNEIGPRGAIRRWRVVDLDGREVFSNANRVACLAFVEGVRHERGAPKLTAA